VPFLIAIHKEDAVFTHHLSYEDKVKIWLRQVLSRLFPFQRGLVHSYWAGNVWAIYVALYKVGSYILRSELPSSSGILQQLWSVYIPSPHMITPGMTAICMLLAQLPGLYMAWISAYERSNIKLLQSFMIVSLGTFLFQYHAHEKAIVTSLLPCIVWYTVTRLAKNNDYSGASPTMIQKAGSILFDMNAYSILGIYPLLFRSQELLVKIFSTILYLTCIALWSTSSNSTTQNKTNNSLMSLITSNDHWFSIFAVTITVIQLEIPYLWLWGKYEFMPLATTSLVCACGYLSIYFRLINLENESKNIY